MLELLAYWFGISVLLLPTVFMISFWIEMFVNKEVVSITKGEHRIEFLRKIYEKHYCDQSWDGLYPVLAWLVTIADMLFIAGASFGFVLDCDTGEVLSLVESVSTFSEFCIPLTIYIAPVVTALVLYFFVIKKSLVKGYEYLSRIAKL